MSKLNYASNPDLSRPPSQDDSGKPNPLKRNKPDDHLESILDGFMAEMRERMSNLTDDVNKTMLSTATDIGHLLDEVKDLKQSNQLFKSEIKADLREVQSSCTALQNSIKDIDAKQLSFDSSLTKINKQLDSHASQITKLTQDTNKLTETQMQVRDLDANFQLIDLKLASKDQRDRINNLEITCVPLTKGENLNTLIHNLAIKTGFNISSTDIDSIHRVRKFPSALDSNQPASHPNIIVRFVQRKRRDEFLAACKSRRGLTTVDLGLNGASRPISVNEHLTPENKKLYKKVRDARKERGYTYVWTKDCKLFVRKNDTSKIIHIATEADLAKIK
ncbi:hypothetical protein O0L34_g13678 [Tuta absoluta]|nr:hypothetical protein O0L34_g13678 [Tuta absoluta]